MSDCTICFNDYGIFFDTSFNNSIVSNYVYDNNVGIYILSSDGNIIYNNYFRNVNNSWGNGYNIWNISKTPGKNIVNGDYLGGNYWHDYNGSDTNGDGLGDTSYNNDSLPLMTPWDVNGDGIVNISDLIMVGQCWLLSPSSPEWKGECDINKDDVVNILDLIIIGQHWGEHLP